MRRIGCCLCVLLGLCQPAYADIELALSTGLFELTSDRDLKVEISSGWSLASADISSRTITISEEIWKSDELFAMFIAGHEAAHYTLEGEGQVWLSSLEREYYCDLVSLLNLVSSPKYFKILAEHRTRDQFFEDVRKRLSPERAEFLERVFEVVSNPTSKREFYRVVYSRVPSLARVPGTTRMAAMFSGHILGVFGDDRVKTKVVRSAQDDH